MKFLPKPKERDAMETKKILEVSKAVKTMENALKMKCGTKYQIINKEGIDKETQEYIKNNYKDIDIILINAIECDGNIVEFINSYPEDYMLSKTIIIDNLKLDCYNFSKGNYMLYNVIKPNYKIEDLIVYFEDIINRNNKYDFAKAELYDEIGEYLKTYGIAPDKNGFHYLRKAIYECYSNPRLLTSITKDIYPLVAKSFDKNSSCVERSIRSAIETGWDRINYELVTDLFKNCVDCFRAKPTNGEFISIIVDKLLVNHGKNLY